jgi:tetratricopeptide (TPR) repeat protein
MKPIPTIPAALLLLSLTSPPVFAEGAGIEWDILNQEVMELHRAGKYDRAVVVAQKALEVAENSVGADHPDVATSLNNLAGLYRATERTEEAEKLERRAERIRAMER